MDARSVVRRRRGLSGVGRQRRDRLLRDRLLEQGGFSHEPLAGEVRERWRSWGDAVTEFVDEFIEPNADGRFSTTEAYNRFKEWHRRNKDGTPPSQ